MTHPLITFFFIPVNNHAPSMTYDHLGTMMARPLLSDWPRRGEPRVIGPSVNDDEWFYQRVVGMAY